MDDNRLEELSRLFRESVAAGIQPIPMLNGGQVNVIQDFENRRVAAEWLAEGWRVTAYFEDTRVPDPYDEGNDEGLIPPPMVVIEDTTNGVRAVLPGFANIEVMAASGEVVEFLLNSQIVTQIVALVENKDVEDVEQDAI